MHRRLLRPLLTSLAVLLALTAGGGVIGGCIFSAPTYRGPKSDHFDGERFINLEPREQKMSFLDWQLHGKPVPWKGWHELPPGPPPPRRVERGALRVTLVNHATVLLQLDGLNILTDPIYSERCSPVSFAGPRRVHPPGIRFEDLPPIDVVVLSHNHYDHMDVPTPRRLQGAFPELRIFAGLGNRAFLEGEGLRHVTEVDWWQEVALSPEVTLVSARTQHFSSRGLFDRDGTLWTGYPPVHISPREAVLASVDLGARYSVPMHHGTFDLADEGETEPVEDLRRALVELGPEAPEWWVLGFGEGRDVPRVEAPSPSTASDASP